MLLLCYNISLSEHIFFSRSCIEERDGKMHWQDIKVHVVVISLVIGLAAFLSVQWLYNSLNFQQPLEKKLDNSKFIESYRIERSSNEYKIIISCRETDNLMQTYQEMYGEVAKTMNEHPFVIELVDQRNDRLVDVFNQGQFAIQEAMFRGNFREMADSLNQYARSGVVESSVYIDEENIYWQMRDGNNYLYEVTSRKVFDETGLERGQDGV